MKEGSSCGYGCGAESLRAAHADGQAAARGAVAAAVRRAAAVRAAGRRRRRAGRPGREAPALALHAQTGTRSLYLSRSLSLFILSLTRLFPAVMFLRLSASLGYELLQIFTGTLYKLLWPAWHSRLRSTSICTS